MDFARLLCGSSPVSTLAKFLLYLLASNYRYAEAHMSTQEFPLHHLCLMAECS